MKTNRTIKRAALLGMMLGMAALTMTARADFLTWNGGAGNSAWDGTSLNWGGAAWDNGHAAWFNTANGSSQTLTVSEGVGVTRHSDNVVMQFANGSGTFVFQGADLTLLGSGGEHFIDVTGGGSVTFNNKVVSQIKLRLAPHTNSTLTLNGGLSVTGELQIGWFFNGTVRFTGGTFSISESVVQTQDWFVTGASKVTSGGGHNALRGSMTVNGADAAVSFAGDAWNNAAGNSENGGAINLLSGTMNFSNGLSVLNADNSSVAGAVAALNVSGGALTVGGNTGLVLVSTFWNGGAGSAYFSLSDGVVSARSLNFTQGNNTPLSTAGAAANISGGLLLLGADGIRKKVGATAGLDDANIAFHLTGGTLATRDASWSSDVNMVIDSGRVTFQAAELDGTAHDITINAGLSGGGGIAKTGGGTLLLTGANTYAGDTIVSAGTLQLNDALSLGGVADLSVFTGATVNLNYSGTAVIDSLLLDGVTISNLNLNQGYRYDELNAALGQTIFSGGGLLMLSSIPEPSTWALLLTGAGLLALMRRRR